MRNPHSEDGESFLAALGRLKTGLKALDSVLWQRPRPQREESISIAASIRVTAIAL
jgi:hypothetical protein